MALWNMFRKKKEKKEKLAAKRKKPANKNPIGRMKRGSVNTKTNRDVDAAPGKTSPNPRARKQSLTRDKVKTVKTKGGDYGVYKKKSAAAKSFRSAFKEAKGKGYKTFTWNGKKYTTKTK